MTSKTIFEVKSLDAPDVESSTDHGVLDVGNPHGATVARAVLQPGWRWSTDVAPLLETRSCQTAHTSYIVSGRFHVRMDDGREHGFGPGDARVVGPGDDAWVVGDELTREQILAEVSTA